MRTVEGVNKLVKMENVQVRGVHMPCEYRLIRNSVQILSMGDVDRTAAMFANGAAKTSTLQTAAEDFFNRIPDSRKIVFLIPTPGVSADLWTCKQALKSDLLSELPTKSSYLPEKTA